MINKNNLNKRNLNLLIFFADLIVGSYQKFKNIYCNNLKQD